MSHVHGVHTNQDSLSLSHTHTEKQKQLHYSFLESKSHLSLFYPRNLQNNDTII